MFMSGLGWNDFPLIRSYNKSSISLAMKNVSFWMVIIHVLTYKFTHSFQNNTFMISFFPKN